MANHARLVLPLLEDEVEVALAKAPAIVRRRPLTLLILLESQSVVLDRLLKVAAFIFAGTTCIRSIDMIRVELEHAIVVAN